MHTLKQTEDGKFEVGYYRASIEYATNQQPFVTDHWITVETFTPKAVPGNPPQAQREQLEASFKEQSKQEAMRWVSFLNGGKHPGDL